MSGINQKCVFLEKSIEKSSFCDRIIRANAEAADMLINADPVWVDILYAGEIVKGLGDYTVTHSEPPIDYEHMTDLHKRGMVSACLLEGWAKTEPEAERLSKAEKLILFLRWTQTLLVQAQE